MREVLKETEPCRTQEAGSEKQQSAVGTSAELVAGRSESQGQRACTVRGMGLAVQAEVFTVYGLSLDRQAWVVSDKTYLQLAYVKPGGSYSTGPLFPGFPPPPLVSPWFHCFPFSGSGMRTVLTHLPPHILTPSINCWSLQFKPRIRPQGWLMIDGSAHPT